MPNSRYRCKHRRYKYDCKVCYAGAFCSHGRRKTRCSQCRAGLCLHGSWKHRCVQCVCYSRLLVAAIPGLPTLTEVVDELGSLDRDCELPTR